MEPMDKSSGTRPEAGDEMRLVARVRAGDQLALAELYDRYSHVVYGVALRVLQDTGAAEDILQDIFLQLWRKPDAFDSSRGAWLHGWPSSLATVPSTACASAVRRPT